MHIHVLGLGPIGCLLAHNLRRALPTEHIITLIHKTWQERRHSVQKATIAVEHKGISVPSEGFQHEVSMKGPDIPDNTYTSPIDSVFVALKAQQTLGALKHLAPRLSQKSTVVLFQNGMGIYEELVSQIFQNPAQRPHFILASNTHGAYIKHSFKVIHAGMGSIEFGVVPDSEGRDFEAGLHDPQIDPSQRRLRISDISPPGAPGAERYKTLQESVAALLLLQDLNTTWRPMSELQRILQRKLVVNAAINPLTALYGCRNGDLFGILIARNMLRQICQEASAVFSAKHDHDMQMELEQMRQDGIDIRGLVPPPFPEELKPNALEEQVLKVANLTKGNVSSMLQDVRSGKKTEIEYINGYIEDLGAEYGVKTPVNATLRNLVKLKYFIPIDQFI